MSSTQFNSPTESEYKKRVKFQELWGPELAQLQTGKMQFSSTNSPQNEDIKHFSQVQQLRIVEVMKMMVEFRSAFDIIKNLDKLVMNHDEQLSDIRGRLEKVISKSELNSLNQIMRSDFENKLDRFKVHIQQKIDKDMTNKVSVETHEKDLNSRVTKQGFEDLKLKLQDYRRDLLSQQQQDSNQNEFSDKNISLKRIRQLNDQIDLKYDEDSGKELERKIRSLSEQVQKLQDESQNFVQELSNIRENLGPRQLNRDSSVDTSEMMETVSDLEIDGEHLPNENQSNFQSSRTPQTKGQFLAEDSQMSAINPTVNNGNITPKNRSSSVTGNISQKLSNGDIENLIQVNNPFSGLMIPSQYQNSNEGQNFEFVPKITFTKFEQEHSQLSRVQDLKLNQSFQVASNNDLADQFQIQMRTHQKDELDDKVTDYVQKSQHQQDLEMISSKLKRKSQYFQTQSTWYNRVLKQNQSVQKLIQSKNNLHTDDSTRSNIKMLLNKHGFGDKFLSKLRRIEHVEKRQKIFNQYAQFQLNEVCQNIVEMTHQLEKISDFNLHANNQLIEGQAKLNEIFNEIYQMNKRMSAIDTVLEIHQQKIQIKEQEVDLMQKNQNIMQSHESKLQTDFDSLKKQFDSQNNLHQNKESGLEKKLSDLHHDFDQLKFLNKSQLNEIQDNLMRVNTQKGKSEYKISRLEKLFNQLVEQFSRSSSTFITQIKNIKDPLYDQILNQMEETKFIENELKKTQSQVNELNMIKTAFSITNDPNSNNNLEQSIMNDTHSVGTYGNFSKMLNKNSSTNLLQSRIVRKNLNKTSQLVINAVNRPKSNQVSMRNIRKMSSTPQNKREGTLNDTSKFRQPVYQHINLNVDGPQYLNNTMIDQKVLLRYINGEKANMVKSDIQSQNQALQHQKTKFGNLELKRFDDVQDVLREDRTVKPLNEISFVQFNNLSLQKVISPDSVSRIVQSKRPQTVNNLNSLNPQ